MSLKRFIDIKRGLNATGQRVSRHLPPWIAVALTGVANALLYFPGQLHPDASDQLDEVRSGGVSDWHSPWLTHVWRQIDVFQGGHGHLLVLQLAMFWGGASWLSWTLLRSGDRHRAWAVLFVCLLPQFCYYNVQILKDTTFYSAMFMASAAWYAAWYRGKAAPIGMAAALAATMMAAPIRMNGSFACAGLISTLFLRRQGLGLAWIATGAIVLSAALLMGIRWVNTKLLNAQAYDVVQSLQIHDLMGIQYHSRDERVWGRFAIDNPTVDRCYTSFYWDSLSPSGVCATVRARLGAPNGRHFTPEARTERMRLWIVAITSHPLAYVKHRLHHFNSAIYFVVPALHVRFNKEIRDRRRPGLEPFTSRDVVIDYVKRSVLVWPATWIATGIAALLMLLPRTRLSGDATFAVALLVSGLTYAGAYLVVGVATDIRYFLWTQLSVALATVIAIRDLRIAWHEMRVRRAVALSILLGVVGIGYASRLLGASFV